MESFFAYSHSTASNHHRFPYQLTDIHDRVFSIGRITQQYRLFVITLDSLHHHDFIFTYLHSLITKCKTHAKDVRFVLLCPGSKNQLVDHLQKRHACHWRTTEVESMVDWVVSIPLAKQLQIYQTDEHYRGLFLLEVHANGYWQLVRHIDEEEEEEDDDNAHDPLAWLTWSLVATRQECEQRAQACLKKCQTISLPLVNQPQRLQGQQQTMAATTRWGWTVCPLEIKYAILDQMAIPDIIRCTQVFYDDDVIIKTWLFQRLDMHRRALIHFMDLPVKVLDYHERQLSWLLFQLQPLTTL